MLAGPNSAALRVPPERPFQPASRIGDSSTDPDVSGEIAKSLGFVMKSRTDEGRPRVTQFVVQMPQKGAQTARFSTCSQ
jgi:hypothetical protein